MDRGQASEVTSSSAQPGGSVGGGRGTVGPRITGSASEVHPPCDHSPVSDPGVAKSSLSSR
jgi:hypothetical protein